MKHKIIALGIVAASTFAAVAGYGSPQARAQTPPSGYGHFTSAVSLWVDGANVVIQANAVPDHKSPYFFPTTDPRYEAYNGSNPNWAQNPNHIASQTVLLRAGFRRSAREDDLWEYVPDSPDALQWAVLPTPNPRFGR